MPEDPKPLPSFGKKGLPQTYSNRMSNDLILPGGDTQYNKGLTAETDPVWTGGSFDGKERMRTIEGGLDNAQSNWDKLGNGLAKFGGSFTESALGFAGSIYGIGASIVPGGDGYWNNAITRAGAQITDYMGENFRNYKSKEESYAAESNPWSPAYWKTVNFMTESVLGNAGYAAGAWATGGIMSKLLSSFAPLIARGALAEGLNVARTGGVEALEAFTNAKRAVGLYDKVQVGLSTAFSAAGEASIEAIHSYNEVKKKLIDEAGGESNLTAEQLAKIEETATTVGNSVFGLNMPILTVSNVFQFGRSLLNYKSLAQKGAKNVALRMGEDFGQYAAKDAATGFKAGAVRALKTIGTGVRKNATEAAEEGAQFIAGETSKNYYTRKLDKDATNDTLSYLDAVKGATHELFTSEEGVASLIAGFATPAIMPYGYREMYDAIAGTKNKQLQDYQLQLINNISAKDSIKKTVEAAARAASINEDLEAAVRNGNEYEARNLKHDAMKSYIQSRIEAGRYDLLEDEIKAMKKMDAKQFKETFDIETEGNFDHNKLLDNYIGKAREMQKTWLTLDRLFQPALYRFNDAEPETRKKAIEQMNQYKEQAWSYMMDAKDADGRITELRRSVDKMLGGVVSLQNIFGNKSKDDKINDFVKEYNTLAIEYKINRELDPAYESTVEADVMKSMMKSLRSKVKRRISKEKPLGLEHYLEKGDPEFLEEYLFDVDTQLANINTKAVFEKALMGGKDGVVDVRAMVQELNDLRKLETRRRVAIQSYNNYATMVKEGKYMDVMVKNPNHDPSDENSQEYILNEKLLQGDNYAAFMDERERYEKQKAKEAKADEKAAKDFAADLKGITRKDSTHPKAAAYQAAYSKYLNGDAATKGFASMTADEFAAAQKEMERESLRHKYAQTFRVDTPEARAKFPYDEYVDYMAKLKAMNTSHKKRRKQWENAMRKIGKKAAAKYVTIFNEQGEEAAEEIYNNTVAETNEKYGPEGSAIIVGEIDKVRTELGVGVVPPAPELKTETEETTEEEEKEEDNDADLSNKEPEQQDDSKLGKGGAEPDNLKGGTTSDDEKVIEDHLNKDGIDVSSTYLILQHSDLENEEVMRPVYNMQYVNNGETLLVDGVEWKVANKDDESQNVIFNVAGKIKQMGYTQVESIMKAGNVLKAYKENVFNDDGSPKTRQFNGDLYDPSSPISLIPGRKIRLERTSDPGKPVQWVKVWVKKGNTDDWIDTGMSYSLDKSRVAGRFPASSKVRSETIQRIEGEVEQLGAEVKKRKYVYATIGSAKDQASGTNSFGFGKLVFNKGKRGQRESKGAISAFGLDFINNLAKTGGVLFGTISSDLPSGATVARLNKDGHLTSLQSGKVYIPQTAIDALTKAGNKAGQAVAALPTAQMHEGKQVYLPVLLHTRQLADDVSPTLVRDADGQKMSLGEAIVDVLLNPGKAEYASSFASLYEFAMGVPFDPAKPNYEGFYTNDNLFKITSNVFYSNLNTGVRESELRYKFPFGLFAERKGDGGIAVTLDITKTAKGQGRTAKKALVYITTKDGKLNTRSVDERMADYLKSAPEEANGKKVNIDRNLQYREIQDQLRKKPYRVDMHKASLPLKESQPYTTIVLGENGMPTAKRFDSYLHYLDEQQILTTTVGAVKDGPRQFYFVNRVIPYTVNYGEKEEVIPPAVNVVNKAKDAQVKEAVITEAPKPAAAKKEEPVGNLNLNALNMWSTDSKGVMTPKKDMPKDPETPFANAITDWFNTDTKELIDYDRIITADQFTIKGLEAQTPAFAEQITQELTDMLLEQYTKVKKSETFGKRKVKRMLMERLEARLPELEKRRKEASGAEQKLLFDRIHALQFAMTFFDEADFDTRLSPELRKKVRYTTTDGKEAYFVGFFNLALNDLFKSKIVQVSAFGKQHLDFESRDGLDYTTRYDDNWSFKVDPRSTLSKFARILMSRVPQQAYHGTTTLSDDYGPLGLVRYMPYESVHKTLIAYTDGLLPHQVFSFVDSIPTSPEMANTPALMGIYKLLQQIRNDNPALYNQAVRHLFNANLLQQANYLIINITTKEGEEAEQKIYDASRQMINDEILSRWSKGLTKLIRQGKYVETERTIDKETGMPVTLHRRKQMMRDGESETMADYIRHKLRTAFADTTENRWNAIADVYVNDMGFPLTGDSTVESTANVLKAWSKTRKVNDVMVPAFQRHFDSIRQYASLEEMVDDTLVNLVAVKLEETLSKEGEPSSFNPEEPLKNSTAVMNAYAKALKGQFEDVVNATVNDINNKSRYIYVTRNNIAENMLFAKDVEHMRQVAQSSYGKYMPVIKDLFDANGELNNDNWNAWTKMQMDFAGGVVRDGYRKSEASDAKSADWNVMSLLMYQNDEKLGKNGQRSGRGKYVMSFGDASTAPYYEAPKEPLLMHFKQKEDGSMHLLLREEHKVSKARMSTAREQMYNIFKTEVNRSVEAYNKFEKLAQAEQFDQIEKQLRAGFHYVKDGENYHMGAAAGIFGFNEKVYEQMLSEGSPLFTVTQTATGPRVAGIQSMVLNEDGTLNDDYLRTVFKGFADDFINDLVDAKMEQLKPFMKDLLHIEKKVTEDGYHTYEGFSFPLFSKNYRKSFESIVKESGFYVERDGETVLMHQLATQEVMRVDDQILFTEASDIDNSSYAALLFKAMIADQQINHFLFQAKWSAFNGADPALFTKDGSTSYKSWYDNYNKRLKEFVTPKIQSITTKEDKVKMITFNDPQVKQFKTTITTSHYDGFNQSQRDIVEYLIENKVGAGKKAEYVAVRNEEDDTVTLPNRVIGGQVETMFHLMRDMWDTNRGATKASKAKFNKALGEYFNAKVTDGNSYVTLREYLYRAYLDGRIADEAEFNQLLKTYENPNLSLTDEQFRQSLPLLGLKYVKSGVKFEGGEMLRIYGKDGEFVLFPALTSKTHFDGIRVHMEALEDKGLNGGVILSPVSAMKLGAHNAIDLFDSSGKYTEAVEKAVTDNWTRDVLGKQIQNPDKFTNETTAASQANTNIHNNIPAATLFGNDKLTNYQVMDIKHGITSELMRRDLEEVMRSWGLKYEEGGAEYQAAVSALKLQGPVGADKLLDIMNGEDPEKAALAYQAYKIRTQIVMANIDEFLNDVKSQLLQRKGLTPNNTYLMRRAEAAVNKMEIPVTFNPSNSQIQSVILSRLNSIVQGRKLPGFSYIQMASVGFSKVNGDSDLKGYTTRYENGEFAGVEPAEIAIPWRLTDEFGNLLDFDTYCKEDGTPKPGMWDDEMLDLIGLRIPNTGPNTMGFFKVKRFLRGYKDVAQVPMEIVAQMNSDFDFDKLVTYQYHYKMVNGVITKVKGYMHKGEKGTKEWLNTPEAKQKAAEIVLNETDAEYRDKAAKFNALLDAKLRDLSVDILADENNGLSEDEAAMEMEDLLKLSRAEKMEKISMYLYDEAQGDIMQRLDALEATEAAAAKDFDMKGFLKRPDALQLLQSTQQLENALIDTYHMMLRNTEVSKQMLSPLTTDYMKGEVDDAKYGKQSLRNVKQSKQFMSPNAEVSKSAVRGSSSGADAMIGILANFQKMAHLAQIADLALEEGPAIYFADKNGKVIEETQWNKDQWSVHKKGYDDTAAQKHMTAKINGKQVNVPYRLGRLFTKGEDGTTVSVAEAGAASLQAALDNLNDPLLGVAGITSEVANEFQLMLLLGYVDHAVPFLNQPIIQEYAAIVRGTKDITSSGTYEEQMNALIDRYVKAAGMDAQYNKIVSQLSKDTEPKAREIAGALIEDLPAFSPAQLRDNITILERTPKYYHDQLAVLEMMLRMKERGQRNFELQQAVNVDSKGLKDTSIIGVDDQLTKYNEVQGATLINAGKITRWSFTHTAAKRYGLDTVRDLFEFGAELDMFQDLKPAFTTLREKTAALHKRGNTLDVKKQVNIGIIQWLLSDPQLFSDMVRDITGEDIKSAADMRELLMKEDYNIATNEQSEEYYDLANNAATTVAGLLERVRSTTDARSGKSFEERYPIIANLRAFQQSDNLNPSVVVYLNANNYKQQLDILLPQSIMQMLRDPNEDVQKLAKMLIVYGYMVGGTNNPISYVTHIPQEVLFQHGFGSKLRAKMDDMNARFAALELETAAAIEKGGGDDRPYIVKYLSGAYTRKGSNKETLNMLRSFIAQYYQHKPYDYTDRYTVNKEQVIGSEPSRYRVPVKHPVPLVVVRGQKKKDNTVLFANGDGTWAQVDTLGFRYNTMEYSYNTQGNPGVTMVGQSQNAYNLAAPKVLKTADTSTEQQPIPYRPAGDKTDITPDFKVPVTDMLQWTREDAIASAARTGNSDFLQSVELVDYIMPLIPTKLQFTINTKMEAQGRVIRDSTTAMPSSFEYNPTMAKADERVHLRMVTLHESLHAGAGHAIKVIQAVRKGTVIEATGAKTLKVTQKQFKEMMAAYGELEAMVSDDTFKKLLQQKLYNTFGQTPSASERSSADQILAYTFGDVEEFMAFTFSDGRFRKALNELTYGGEKSEKSFWTRFVELFSKLLGINKGSALEHALFNTLSIMEPIRGKAKKANAKLGKGEKTEVVEMPDYRKHTMFTEETKDVIPFYVDLQQVAERYNYKQVSC